MPTGGAVIDVLGDLADDLAREVAIETGDQGGWNNRARLDLEGRKRLLKTVLQIAVIGRTAGEESLLSFRRRGRVAREQILNRG